MADEIFFYGFAFGIAATILVFMLVGGGLLIVRPWIRLKLTGGRGTLLQVLAMRFRGTQPMRIVNAYTALLHSGVNVSLREVESHYVANRSRLVKESDLIEHVRQYKQREAKASTTSI